MAIAFDPATGRKFINRFESDIAVGAVCGLVAIVQSISAGTLLFSGLPNSLTSAGVGMSLVSSAIAAVLVAFAGSSRRVIAICQDLPAAALSGILAAVTASVMLQDERTVLVTVVAAVALTTLAIGAGIWLVGFFQLSRLVRFIPFPVVGGFLAGSGWLILTGGINTTVGTDFTSAPLALLAEPGVPLRLLSAGALVIAIATFQRLSGWQLAPPVTIATAIVLFNIIVWFMAIPHDTLRTDHWLMPLPNSGTVWPPITPMDLTLIDWHAIASHSLSLSTVPLLVLIATLMNTTATEIDTRRDMDLDRELRAVGLANLAVGASAGVPSYHGLSLTLLASRLGGTSAVVGVVAAVFCVVAAFFGAQVLSAVPMPLLGGVLIWMGGSLVRQWLVQSYSRLPAADYVLIVLIFAIIAIVGFAWGIVIGLVAAGVVFVVEYGRVDIVRYTLTGRDYQTGAESSDERRRLLHDNGGAILFLRLNGFLFFGTADRLRKRIQQRIAEGADDTTRFLVIDFDRVSGLDSSAVLAFVRLAQMAQPNGIVLVLTSMSDTVEQTMRRGGLEPDGEGFVHIESSFESGVEWCENALLADIAPTFTETDRSAREMLLDIVGDSVLAEALMPYLERVRLTAGDVLISQGEPSEDLYFIQSARAAVEISKKTQRVRLATLTHGALVSEMAFYLKAPRSASVIAESELVAWRFNRTSLDEMHMQQPVAAACFHRGIAALLAERLTRTNRLVQLLAD